LVPQQRGLKSEDRQNSKISLIRSRLKEAYRLLSPCRACPRHCGVDRLAGETGLCGMGFLPEVASDNLHFGEEPPVSGTRGSGTIFFSGCSLRCVFCQNFPISQLRHGKRITLPGLADMMLGLQERGAHNINLVTPSHFAPQIMAALLIAYEKGLRIPIVYNCGGYESIDMLRLWDGIIDVYMPDMKYSDPEPSRKYSDAPDYPEVNRDAILEMARQVGTLVLDDEEIAVRGLLIRHLVLPGDASGTESVLRFISERVSPLTRISLMRQYFPAHRSHDMPPMNRKVTDAEYSRARSHLVRFGLEHGWIQE
jgi:putative pyruvate formate lyase activating enzyme